MVTKKDTDEIKKAVSGEDSKEQKLTDLPGIGPAVAAKLEAAGYIICIVGK
jgi:predicted flap endonuclease-1-like 5' DNA nuclease